MKDYTLLSSEEILGISTPEKLFSASTEEDIKKIYRKLSMLWHPDKHILDGKDTSNIFAHIQSLYEKSLVKISNNEWNKGNLFKIKDENGSEFEIKYLIEKPFEFGRCFVSKSFISWEFTNSADDLFVKNTIKSLSELKFANDKMKSEMTKYLPKIEKTIKTKDSTIIVMKKDIDSISLRDVLTFYNGFVDPKHVAWILSTMYNFACFNQYNNLMQAGFSLDNYFITPKDHTGQILGGWWFSQKNNEKLIALSTDAVNVAPIKILNTKKSDFSLDLELIKLVGRQLLGDYTGIQLRKDTRIPKELVNWLNDSLSVKPIEAYNLWQNEVLIKSFGVRRFTKMDLTLNDIYN